MNTALSKVPEVTLVFWIIKILATTLGETGGEALSMSLDLGYLLSTGIFFVIFAVAVLVQMRAARFHPVLYWATIIATTTVGTTLADFADRSLGIGYAGGSAMLLALLLTSLLAWYRTLGSIAVETLGSPKSEAFYWITIMFSQTLGTALGDWVADTEGFGYTASAILFGALLAVIGILYFTTKVSRVALFLAAFILTHPPARCRGRGLPRQATQQRRPGLQPLLGLRRPAHHDRCADAYLQATGSGARALTLTCVLRLTPRASDRAHPGCPDLGA